MMELLTSGFGVACLVVLLTAAAVFLLAGGKKTKEAAPPAGADPTTKPTVNVTKPVNGKQRRRRVAHLDDAPAAKKKGAPAVADIEDAFKSLVPITLKQMKADGITPYTAEERRAKLDELDASDYPNFVAKVQQSGQGPLTRKPATVFQANIGLHCNQACTHCHVDSSPKRKEMMDRETTDRCLEIIGNSPTIEVVDLTGGAPEINKEFRHWVVGARALGKRVIDRCNLTVLLEPNQQDLVPFLVANQVHIIASLPCYLETNVDTQRGDSVFERSIKGLQMLNQAGYGTDSTLRLDLVYNPTGIHLPPAKSKLEGDYKRHLDDKFGIVFDNLITITNMPINRFYDYLKDGKQLDKYMDILVDGYNPATVAGLMCRDYISVKWDGHIYDCDFNQQVELHPKAKGGCGLTVFDIDSAEELLNIPIATGKHCYGCTAGAGSA